MTAARRTCWWVLMLMLWVPCAQAQTGAADVPSDRDVEVSSSAESAAAQAEPKKRKAKSSGLFWIVLVISLLFIVGSASALSAIGGKQPASRQDRRGGQSADAPGGSEREKG